MKRQNKETVFQKSGILWDRMAIDGLRALKTIYTKKDNSEGKWTVTLELLDYAIKAIEENEELKKERDKILNLKSRLDDAICCAVGDYKKKIVQLQQELSRIKGISVEEIDKILKDFPVPKTENKTIDLWHQMYRIIWGDDNPEHKWFKQLAQAIHNLINKEK